MKALIEDAWSLRGNSEEITFAMENAVFEAMECLDSGQLRVAEKDGDSWQVNDWLKKAILLYFTLTENVLIDYNESKAYDKIPLKTRDWDEKDFKKAKFRAVPGSIIRYSSFIAPKVVLMPSFINVGAYIDEGTLIDTWATVGSCAQIGKHCHISGGVGIGGVLEPIQANPVIIEDNVFIGARSEIAEGVIVGEGAVISMGVYIGSSTRIYDRAKDKIYHNKVPPFSVVVPGVLPSADGKTLTYAAIIVKTVDEQTRAKTSINEILRK